MSALRHDLPCGCWRGIVARSVPAFDLETGAPKLDDAGAITFDTIEEVEEGYCDEHSNVIKERQAAAAKCLVAGGTADEAARLMAGASPFLALDGHEE